MNRKLFFLVITVVIVVSGWLWVVVEKERNTYRLINGEITVEHEQLKIEKAYVERDYDFLYEVFADEVIYKKEGTQCCGLLGRSEAFRGLRNEMSGGQVIQVGNDLEVIKMIQEEYPSFRSYKDFEDVTFGVIGEDKVFAYGFNEDGQIDFLYFSLLDLWPLERLEYQIRDQLFDESVLLDIKEDLGQVVYGTGQYVDEPTGFHFIASQYQNSWSLVHQSQDSIDCGLVDEYGFSADTIPLCWDSGHNELRTR